MFSLRLGANLATFSGVATFSGNSNTIGAKAVRTHRVSNVNLSLTQLLFCHDSGPRSGCSTALELRLGVGSPALSNFGGEI